MSGWYDTYVNAVWKMGLIEGSITDTPKKALTYGTCKELIDKLIINRPEYQNVYTNLDFDFIKSEDEMKIEDFLQLYEAILALTPADTNPIQKETLFVIGREVTEDGKDRMVTDLGKYYYLDAKSYENYYEKLAQPAVNSEEAAATEDAAAVDTGKVNSENLNQTADDQAVNPSEAADEANSNQNSGMQEVLGAGAVLSEADRLTGKSISDIYLDKGIQVLVRDQEIIYVTSITLEKIVIHNVWIKSGSELNVDTFINGIDKSFTAKFPLSNSIEKVVGDITVENQKVVQISVKPDMIQGKVLQTGDDFIEIEGYGKVPLDDGYKIYKIYGELTLEPTSSILVGYKTTDFVVSNGKISAALITEEIKAENIRVLLKTTDFSSIYHAMWNLLRTRILQLAIRTQRLLIRPAISLLWYRGMNFCHREE
jgi:stage II sporulation protein D